MATQRAAAGVSIDEQIAAIHRSKGLTSDSDSKIGPRIPQLQDQHSHQHQIQHIHQQGLQQHMPSAQQPMYASYPSHTTQNVPIPQGPLPVAYPGYVGSSAPFAHQLPGFITPIAPVTMSSQSPSQVRPPIPPIPQLHRQSLPEDEVDMGILPKRQKLDNSSSMGALVSEEEWIASHQGLINVQIQCPIISEKPEWNCQGQIIVLDSLSVTTLVSAVKDKIFARLNFPAGKQKLTIGGAVMKNQVSLAYYNIDDGGILGLAIKDRGKK
ncbi:4792_t:CDS:2 [Dentiscutata heterogama]|uniref:4792_t:CDS:1 n=1 Tax=Dentiscutata heterogama TaxID=1316150 RepID=A0ACA9NP25_9GLOM|nr:4792_t:CDS:2 [Dentiscutata heterogama]